jgi:hypothetical protein
MVNDLAANDERPAGDIRFMTQGHEEPFLTLKPDGTIEVGSFVKPDEAAKLFLDSLADLFPQWTTIARSGGVRELVTDGTIVKVVIRGGAYGLFESTPKQIEQAKRDAEIVNAALRAAKDT